METAIAKEERTWATIAHLSALLMYFTGVGHIVGPLVVWLIKREGNPFLDDQGKEALNFNISWSILMLANFALFFTVIGAIVAIPLFFALPIFHLIFIIVASVKANEGVLYRYPLTFRLIS